MPKANQPRHILLTWDSFNAGFQVTVQAIEQLRKKHQIYVSEVLYLQNEDLNEGNLTELKVFQNPSVWEKEEKSIRDHDKLSPDKKDEIIKRLAYVADQAGQWNEEKTTPLITQKRLNIKGVTDYQSIYDKARGYLHDWEQTQSIPFHLHINVSPGTPQMHVGWLMLNASGYLPPDTRLWSTQYDRKKDQQRLDAIVFKPKTYLSEILQQNSHALPGPEVNPNDFKSARIKEAIVRLEMYAAVPSPLLILGERGVGKSTLVRKHLHERLYPDLPFRELACGTFREELFRSELFGYKKGAFTGADKEKEGILDQFKENGILFLDEIHDLSLALQRDLIQVLQTGEFYPIGSTEPKKARFRLITATNCSLPDLVAPGCLAADFFDRIAHLHLSIPALRDCREDLVIYWEKVWKEMFPDEKNALLWDKTLELFLQKSDLPGNFRDLQRLAARIYAHFIHLRKKNPAKAIKAGIEDFSLFYQELGNISEEKSYFRNGATFKDMEAHFRKDLVAWAVSEYGNIEAAAKTLKRAVPTLYQDKRG